MPLSAPCRATFKTSLLTKIFNTSLFDLLNSVTFAKNRLIRHVFMTVCVTTWLFYVGQNKGICMPFVASVRYLRSMTFHIVVDFMKL